jgi:hypothetical protein
MDPLSSERLLDRLRLIQARIRDRVIAHTEAQDPEEFSRVAEETPGDTIYQIDRVTEEALLALFDEHLASETSFVLIGEGLPQGGIALPDGTAVEDAAYRIIVDPIDGTRGLMYDKRSAWVLSAAAPNRGPETSLQDIVAAVQTEIPTSKTYRCDAVWAAADGTCGAESWNRFDGTRRPLRLRPSRARTVEHGFAMISRFFPGTKEVLARAEEALVEALIGPVEEGRARLFEDQYISSGGQFYELMAGHDRFNADLRPNAEGILRREGRALGICCHPYDVCVELVARSHGVAVTDPNGAPLNAPLDTTSPVAWVGYANTFLRAKIEPVLQRVLREHGLL